ncbi:histone deacetylase [Pedococcus sp. 5OH_020]|uniref:histone deacetylase n=1 Tax=Pedococcus sp. 5OH_020 TaxID=2989814 RepID=UPI0022EA0D2B|nr:histone deacetylase [Pedococcus sp. 5OH_020]
MHVWYASYGSNLRRDRFLCYLQGGRPPGAARTYPGARDTTLPQGDQPFRLPGSVFFGWSSPTWGGGIAFYDAHGHGVVLARAYLVTWQQFADVAAQEMHREPGRDLDLRHVLAHARHELGPGRYEALHRVGDLDGHPVLTFTTPDATALQRNPPSEAYLAMIGAGLRETHGLTDDEAASYLLACPGMTPAWDEPRVLAVLGSVG